MSDFTGESHPIGELDQPALAQAYGYWQSRRAGRAFPSRQDIRPEDMRAFLRHVMLVDVACEPLNFTYRVFGTGIANAHRQDYTNKSVRDIAPAAFARLVWRQYREAVERRAPVLHSVVFRTVQEALSYRRLTLPLSSDGSAIDKLLAVSVEDRRFWDAIAEDTAEAARRQRYSAAG